MLSGTSTWCPRGKAPLPPRWYRQGNRQVLLQCNPRQCRAGNQHLQRRHLQGWLSSFQSPRRQWWQHHQVERARSLSRRCAGSLVASTNPALKKRCRSIYRRQSRRSSENTLPRRPWKPHGGMRRVTQPTCRLWRPRRPRRRRPPGPWLASVTPGKP